MKYIIFCFLLGVCEILGSKLLDPHCASSQFGNINTGGRNNSAPWMVSLHEGNYYFCAGSLISKAFVLTAAHCNFTKHQQILARLGEHDLNIHKHCPHRLGCNLSNVYKVQFIYTHPKYESIFNYDIAILKLEREVRYTDYIRPICLLKKDGIDEWQRHLVNIKQFSAHGWGAKEYFSESDILHTMNLTQTDRITCHNQYNYTVDMIHICAGDSHQHVSTGDSGGPLGLMVTNNSFKYYVQMGIVSYGVPLKRVAVFTNVLSFADWIENVIKYDRKYMTRN